MRRAAALLAVVLLAACEAAPQPGASAAASAAAPAAEVSWARGTLPVTGGAAMTRDAVWCPGGWFVVGAVRDPAGGTRPAAWHSTDGMSWTPLRFAATSYYGRQNILSTAACRDGRLAAVGAKVGGAHGNPRTSSWAQSADGVLREVTAPFELFGGPRALNVSRLAAGPAGFLITGNRMSGAAVWLSPDAARFTIREGAPGLTTDAAGMPWAFDGAGLAGGGWLVVGGFLPAGRTDRDPAGWTSADGATWRRAGADDASGAYEELHRVVAPDGGPVALGVAGPVFRAWRLIGDRWRPAGSFGAVRPGGGSGVRSLTARGGRLWAATTDGAAYAVWLSADGGARWRPVPLPAPVAAGAERSVLVADGGARVVLVADDGIGAHIYSAETGA